MYVASATERRAAMPFSEKQISILSCSPLFMGVDIAEINSFLTNVGVSPSHHSAGEQLVCQDEAQSLIHIVLSGKAVGERLLSDGRAVIVNEFEAGEVFGDMLSGAEEKSPVTVSVSEDGEILRLPFSALISQCEGHTATREKVIRNLITEIADKYFALQGRLDMLLCSSLRGKIAKYLIDQREKHGTDSFVVPHSREEQSRILNCDRSALSRELSRIKHEGIISYNGRHFEIKDPAVLKAL